MRSPRQDFALPAERCPERNQPMVCRFCIFVSNNFNLSVSSVKRTVLTNVYFFWIRSDETSAFESLYGGQFTLSTQLIN